MLTPNQIQLARVFHKGDCARRIALRGGTRIDVEFARRTGPTLYENAINHAAFIIPVQTSAGPAEITPENAHHYHSPLDCRAFSTIVLAGTSNAAE